MIEIQNSIKKILKKIIFFSDKVIIVIIFSVTLGAATILPKIEQSKTNHVGKDIRIKQELRWPNIFLSKYASGLSRPVHITHAGDGSNRLFVVEQSGRIRIIKNAVLRAEFFLDISDRVLYGGEQGLLSIAFPPGYLNKDYFYVNYTRMPDGATVVSRFNVTADPDIADPDSEEIILTIVQPNVNHNGGQLAFSPQDGYLYIGMGDGGSSGDPQNFAQNPGSLLGKILRIDVESGSVPYSIPPSNPYIDSEGYQPEIWALGLRNPWRFSFDRQTGDLYIADVGQGRREEVDFQLASSGGGDNYGWRILEGTLCYNPPSGCVPPDRYSEPVVEYSHEVNGSTDCSITGGFVYHGKKYPCMKGIYFYGDFCSGKIWGLSNDGGVWYNSLLLDSPYVITSFGEDESGNMYLTDFYTGDIYNITQKEDLLGTWTGQGVYYRNSDTGSWVMMASPATQVTAGDIDNDGIDDLIGIWPGQGGVWVKYSSSGSWALLSATADWIGAGDMNGDGRCDLLGTWTGQGVYYRNSTNGQWIKMATPASQITAGDLDDNGTDDLIGIWPAQGGVWIKYSSSGSWEKLSSTADWIASGDMNGDEWDDLLGTWAGQGAYYKDSASDSWIKMATPATQIAAGDLDGDGTDDLVGIWLGQGGVWVKYSGDETWERLSSTADWIACGKMRSAASSSFEVMKLSGPFGGMARGPSWFEKHEDLSNNGPGGWGFVYQEESNLLPQEQRKLRVMRFPGPGETGFRYIEQKNLLSLEKWIQKITECLHLSKFR